ncbi:SPW repeat domain-containing protein [Deinococcus yavapaiensis]|uniref:SPW repeat-containing integral membrane domain-containing protein n=1 Tax=Deinococcus yavapaiensis KR-236 TaxID=694435 RepID=A0A318S9H0_9DEIO|nr:hypothetical protein [Deinococcus yavapaiensis]PYE54868.1 hypothetical protein DES52_104139 [Deinococcus yavapaiensis KR-236]
MKPIRPGVHGILDYLAAIFLALAPSLFNLNGTPALACYILAVIIAGLTLLTRRMPSIAKAIPVHWHGGIDLVSAFVILALPWILGFSDEPTARSLFVVLAVVEGVVWLLTDWRDRETVTEASRGTVR